MKQLRPIILTIAWMVSLGMSANNFGTKADTSIVKKYQDSLAFYKARYDSVVNANAQMGYGRVNSKLYQLFSPMLYYNGVTKSLFSTNTLDAEENAVNETLANIYMKRPDLVRGTVAQLETAALPASSVNMTPAVASTIAELSNEAPIDADPEPVEVVVEKPKFWTFKGDGFLQFLQNYVSGNWYKGGESNYSLLSSLTLEANYDNKSKWKWDNKLEMKLGFLTSRSDTVNKFKSNEDLIRLTSKVGLQATKHWYYTLQMIAQTQFTRGLKVNDRRIYSDFTSPFDLKMGLGMDYKIEWLNKKLTGTANISPLAVNYRYVDRTIFDNNGKYSWFPSRHGIDEGKHHYTDFGSQFTIDITWVLAENMKWKSRMYGFTSYKRVEYEWENTFTFQFNKYISTNIFVYPRFDDNRARDDDYGYWMFKEYCSIGFNYSF